MPRPIRIEGPIAYIPLTRGYEAVIDIEDLEKVQGRSWFARSDSHNTYAARWKPTVNGKRNHEHLHRIILNPPDNFEVDHIDGDGLNNTKFNLRVVTKSENMCNRPKSQHNVSGYKGVSFCKRNGKWASKIRFQSKEYWLGYFATAEEAYAAYCEASERLHKQFKNTG